MFDKTDTRRPGLVSIITVNFNQTELTCALLESVRQQDYRDVEVIVVDNASSIDPSLVFQERFPAVKYIRSAQNLGFAGGNNLALPKASGEFLFFVNNDAEITTGCIARLVQLLESTPKAGIVSPLICYHPGVSGQQLTTNSQPAYANASAGQPSTANPPTPMLRRVNRPPSAVIQYAGMPRVNPFTGRSNMDGNGQELRGQYPQAFTTGYAHGAAMMIPRKVLAEIGPMQEDYFLYYEEIDWCERIHRAGYSVWVEPRALVWHKESMTMAALGTIKTYYLTRNRILFMQRHYGGWSFLLFSLFLFFVTLPSNLFRYLWKGEWGNIRAFLKGIFLR